LVSWKRRALRIRPPGSETIATGGLIGEARVVSQGLIEARQREVATGLRVVAIGQLAPNQRVQGWSPCTPTKDFSHLDMI
jgi:hypothetical protein